MKANENLYDDEYLENQPHELCPNCGRYYDDIAFDFQYCNKCGWDAEKEEFEEAIKPTKTDYENGDADIITQQWI